MRWAIVGFRHGRLLPLTARSLHCCGSAQVCRTDVIAMLAPGARAREDRP
jgi:hypothetical protein